MTYHVSPEFIKEFQVSSDEPSKKTKKEHGCFCCFRGRKVNKTDPSDIKISQNPMYHKTIEPLVNEKKSFDQSDSTSFNFSE